MPRCNSSFGQRSFSYCTPKIWNDIPLLVRQSASVDSFKRSLKTHYFTNNWPPGDCLQRLWFDILDIMQSTNCCEWMNEYTVVLGAGNGSSSKTDSTNQTQCNTVDTTVLLIDDDDDDGRWDDLRQLHRLTVTNHSSRSCKSHLATTFVPAEFLCRVKFFWPGMTGSCAVPDAIDSQCDMCSRHTAIVFHQVTWPPKVPHYYHYWSLFLRRGTQLLIVWEDKAASFVTIAQQTVLSVWLKCSRQRLQIQMVWYSRV